MRKNLIIIDFIEILDCDKSIRDIINNDKNNDYILICENNINYVKKYLLDLRVMGIYTDFGSSYYSKEKNDYILEFSDKREGGVHYSFDLLIKEVYSYISNLPYILPDNIIYKNNYYYFISLVGSVHKYSEFLYKYFKIEEYRKELKEKLEKIIKENDLNIILIDSGNIGFYILSDKCNKVKIVHKLPSNYYEIFFTGKRNKINREIMGHKRIHDIEINNEDELKYFLETL